MFDLYRGGCGQDNNYFVEMFNIFRGGCSHGRANDYFVESILAQQNGNTFLAWQCDDWDKFKAGMSRRQPAYVGAAAVARM